MAIDIFHSPGMVFLGIFTFLVFVFFLGMRLGKKRAEAQLEERIAQEREDAIKRSRSVLAGQFSEQLAPYLPDFPYKPTEARFIGKPIDFLVFKGMDEKEISEVVFVEVKSGSSNLSTHERKLRDAIHEKKVRWEQYDIPKDLTGKKEVSDDKNNKEKEAEKKKR